MSRLRKTLFLKILLVFAMAGLADIAVLRIFQRNFIYGDLARQHRGLNLIEYGKTIVSQMPGVLSTEKVRAIAGPLYLQIRTDGPRGSYTSGPGVPDFSDVDRRLELRFAKDSDRTGKYRDSMAVEIYEAGGQRWLIFLESEMAFDEHPGLLLFLVSALLVVLLACYFSVRWMLSPLREIERGVREVAAGHLEVELKSRGQDELGRLAQSFNQMTKQVRSMISAKEQLLLDVSHEFRSPLTRIKVAMQLSEAEGRESILRSLKDLETMLSELLESSRLDDANGGLRKEPTDLAWMLTELCHLNEDRKPGIKILFSQVNFEIWADPARLQVALRNLVENALKYSENQNRPVEVNLIATDHETVLVTVQDFGIGIPPAEQALIFEPFYRIDRARMKSTGGYGLGLSLTRKIVLAHGGELRVESQASKGALFTIELNLHA